MNLLEKTNINHSNDLFKILDKYRKTNDSIFIDKVKSDILILNKEIEIFKQNKIKKINKLKTKVDNFCFQAKHILKKDEQSNKILKEASLFDDEKIKKWQSFITQKHLDKYLKISNNLDNITEQMNEKNFIIKSNQSNKNLEKIINFLKKNKKKILSICLPYRCAKQTEEVKTTIQNTFYQKTPFEMPINDKIMQERVNFLLSNLIPYSAYIIQKVMEWFLEVDDKFIKPNDVIKQCENELQSLKNIIIKIENL